MNDVPGMCGLSPGVGLHAPHVGELLARRPDIAWLEVHPENYMADHRAFTRLQRVREHCPLSFHGVALSLGSHGELDWRHLSRLTQLIDCFDPFCVSEHLAWHIDSGAANMSIYACEPLRLSILPQATWEFRSRLADGDTLGRATSVALDVDQEFDVSLALASLFEEHLVVAIGDGIDE